MDQFILVAMSEIMRQKNQDRPLTGWEKDKLRAELQMKMQVSPNKTKK